MGTFLWTGGSDGGRGECLRGVTLGRGRDESSEEAMEVSRSMPWNSIGCGREIDVVVGNDWVRVELRGLPGKGGGVEDGKWS